MWARVAGVLLASAACAFAQAKPRARDLGVPFEGVTGRLNAITDVTGIEVGHTTLIRGQGALKVGAGPVRTGVTVIHPRGKAADDPVFAGWYSLNGNGEMTGTAWIEESGFLEGPIGITNTHSVGIVRDAIVGWQVKRSAMQQAFALPVVAETFDGWLNDVNGFHVKAEHTVQALDGSSSGPVAEGNVGGGTGMICYGFKGGIGTSSRRAGNYMVGALVQANFGRRDQLMVAGVPVGREIACDRVPCRAAATPPAAPRAAVSDILGGRDGSIIIVVATDAPLVAHQLKRLARRAALGLGRTGASSGNGSGDLFVAFSTANPGAVKGAVATVAMMANAAMDPVFDATVQATEEAIVNALVAAETMEGRDGHRILALPHAMLREALKKYGR
jgi:D-aminopeptidase